MKLIYFLILILSLFWSTESKVKAQLDLTVKHYLQKVDHFSYTNKDKFNQRYLINTEHWGGQGYPIFLYTGNEGDIVTFANNTGFMWENAPKFKSMIIFVEHRYYGKSMPYGTKSFQDLSKMGYLTAEQALADYSDFIEYIKQSIKGASKSPVILFGGSYGGMLAAWHRIKYPHLSVGALAASAPILQLPGLYSCQQYFHIVTRDFANYSLNCTKTIRNSWSAFRRVAQTQAGLDWITKTFKLCQKLTNGQLGNFLTWISSTWESLAMTDYPNPASFLQPLPAYPIGVVCQRLTNPNQNDKHLLNDIFNGISIFYNFTGETKCNDIDSFGGLDVVGWNFQSCTEMTLPVCSDGQNDMFEPNPWNVSQYKENCQKSYNVSPEYNKIMELFGGKSIETATNIIFSNGQRDPWSAGGVLESISKSLIAIQIPNACHHEDLRQSDKNDPKELIEVRNKEIKIIHQWINQYYHKINWFPPNWHPNFKTFKTRKTVKVTSI